MKSDDKVRIEKIGSSDYATSVAGNMKDWLQGSLNPNFSLPVDYWIEAVLVYDIRLGEIILAERYIRNGHRCDGVFVSTPVKQIVELIDRSMVITANSVYQITKI